MPATGFNDPYRTGRYEPEPIPVRVIFRQRDGRQLCVFSERYNVVSRKQKLQWLIPPGYVTDWASIPRAAQIRMQPFGPWAWAASIHDWLYSVGEPGQKDCADAVFLEKLEDAGVPFPRRTIMHQAVKLFGGAGYRNAERDWSAAFADPLTGRVTPPPFDRGSAFLGGPHGGRPY